MPIVSFPLGTRRFAPSWPMTLLTLALCLIFIRLGNWQWDRGVHRQAEWDAFARGADAPVPLAARSLRSLVRFKRIAVSGRWDAAHQFLLDNRSHGGLPGYEVLTPLQLPDDRVLLVDRGWVPFTGSRARLPDIAIADRQPVSLSRPARQPAGGRPGAGARGPGRRRPVAQGHQLPHLRRARRGAGSSGRALDAAAGSGRRRLCPGLGSPPACRHCVTFPMPSSGGDSP